MVMSGSGLPFARELLIGAECCIDVAKSARLTCIMRCREEGRRGF